MTDVDPKPKGWVLTIYTVYANPADFPGSFVVRPWQLEAGGSLVRGEPRVFRTLEQARASLPAGLCQVRRSLLDEEQIVETWI